MERYYYLGLLLVSVAFPFLASFEPRIRFSSKWLGLFAGIFVMAAVFLSWDVVFTDQGIWGFNDRYVVGLYILGMPVEEWLFFILIPYACVYLYEVMRFAVRRDILGPAARPISIGLILLFSVIGLSYLDRAYTGTTFLLTAIALAYVLLVIKPDWLGRFYLGYAISLVPFLLVNGVLTGWLLVEPVVWYDDAENLGIRLGTIPLEDSVYLLLMLLIVIAVYERQLSRSP